MYWLDMGLGKTVIALSVMIERMARQQVNGVLVVAPLRVCQTVWAQEAKIWQHTKHLKFNLIHGTPVQRARAALTPADVYLVNYENLVWLVDFLIDQRISRGEYPPFNMGVYDEVTMLKDWSTKRHAAIRKLLPYMPYRMGLTGTPASNGYLDLFGQYLAVDAGARLDHRITYYRDRYFVSSYNGWSYELMQGSKELIQEAVADITLDMKAEDYLELPEVIFNDIPVLLPAKAMKHYRELEDQMFTELDSGVVIDVANAAVLTNKCLQASNGALYDEEGNWELLHNAKLDALEDIYEEAAGQPLLVMYGFRHDHERIKKRFPEAVSFHDYKSPEELVKDWNDGKIKMLIGHPKSIGHGLNLQYGGHIGVWFGLNWSLDLYLQAIARLARQGQKLPVIIHRILAIDTMDYLVRDVLEVKEFDEQELRDAVSAYRRTA